MIKSPLEKLNIQREMIQKLASTKKDTKPATRAMIKDYDNMCTSLRSRTTTTVQGGHVVHTYVGNVNALGLKSSVTSVGNVNTLLELLAYGDKILAELK